MFLIITGIFPLQVGFHIDMWEGKSRKSCFHLCIGCNKTFSRPSRLDTHMLSHTGQRPFKCDLCDKDFTRNAHLKRHKQINHEGLKPCNQELKCDQCGSKFANKYSLKKHVKKTHEVKQYFCDICDKSFHKNHLLRVHKLEHTNDTNPHKCSQCSKQFKYPGQLKRHERIHKGYVCDVCNLNFEKWTDLQHHKASEHVDAKSLEKELSQCDICERKFQSKAFLKRHSLIHKETRETFHCPTDLCPRWFYFKSNLKQHIRSFHEGKKYLCSQSGCTSKFTSKQKLLDHSQGHTYWRADQDHPPSCPRLSQKQVLVHRYGLQFLKALDALPLESFRLLDDIHIRSPNNHMYLIVLGSKVPEIVLPAQC